MDFKYHTLIVVIKNFYVYLFFPSEGGFFLRLIRTWEDLDWLFGIGRKWSLPTIFPELLLNNTSRNIFESTWSVFSALKKLTWINWIVFEKELAMTVHVVIEPGAYIFVAVMKQKFKNTNFKW